MSKSTKKPTYIDFDTNAYKKKLAEKYIINGETGVLSYPYSKQIHKYWKFKTPELAGKSAATIYNIFKKNLDTEADIVDKFIKADICRKFLQMGYTRSMRYYYHKSGKKWQKNSKGQWIILPNDYDYIKLQSATIFKKYWMKCLDNKKYQKLKVDFINIYYKINK